ncbi:major facilitator superfamily domain-containing protein [Xylaria bambusicola]|uniref:major facilitator superfamily domain-containing protein n=1 Tax=Xylaria bambusicola TaxID=326684 RepID=UPI002007FC6F|nr:major facilitator superfamily domain-containing protein [Xylaria bambusicola]KAI0521776.1 major facilitator superfamily domain-containing protein [Xylaria bambusicola]
MAPVAVAEDTTPLLRSERTGSRPSSSHGSEDDDLDVANQSVTKQRAVAIILSVYILIFLLAMNMSGITMAQSTIAADLDAYEDAMWFTTSFLVAMSSMSPLTGKLATIFSPRMMVLFSSLLFSIGCLVTSQAHSFAVFILGRVITGLGGGGTMVLAFILVLELTTKRNRGLFIGITNAGFTTGVSLGAVVFGGLIGKIGWRPLFWAQAPASLLAGCAIFFSIPSSLSSPGQSKDKDVSMGTKLKRLDYLGAIFLSGTVVLFLFGLSGKIQPIPLGSSLGALIIFILIETYIATDPIVPLTVLRNRGALLSCFAQLGFMAARWTVLFYTPMTALAVFGFNPAASGSILIPTNLGFGLGGLLVGALHIRRSGSYWGASVICFALFGISLLALSTSSTRDTPFGLYVAIVFLNGLFTGGALNYTMSHLLHLTLPETHYVATSLLGTFRGFAGSFGSAIGGGIFARTLRGSLEEGLKRLDGSDHLSKERAELVRKLIGSPLLVYNGGLSGAERGVAVQGYSGALRVLFQAAVVLTVFVLLLQAATGWRGPKDEKDRDSEEESESLVV